MAKHITRSVGSWTYVTVADRTLEPAAQTRFICRPLMHGERAMARDELEGTIGPRQVARKLFLSNVTAVENFPVGAPVPWPASHEERVKYLERFDDDDVLEVGDQIFGRSGVSPVEAEVVGKSLPPGDTPNSGGDSAA